MINYSFLSTYNVGVVHYTLMFSLHVFQPVMFSSFTLVGQLRATPNKLIIQT